MTTHITKDTMLDVVRDHGDGEETHYELRILEILGVALHNGQLTYNIKSQVCPDLYDDDGPHCRILHYYPDGTWTVNTIKFESDRVVKIRPELAHAKEKYVGN